MWSRYRRGGGPAEVRRMPNTGTDVIYKELKRFITECLRERGRGRQRTGIQNDKLIIRGRYEESVLLINDAYRQTPLSLNNERINRFRPWTVLNKCFESFTSTYPETFF